MGDDCRKHAPGGRGVLMSHRSAPGFRPPVLSLTLGCRPPVPALQKGRNRSNDSSHRSAQHQRHQTGVGACAYQADSHYKTLQNATRNTTTGALLLWLWIEQYDSAVGGKGILVTSVCLHLCVIGRVCKNLLLLALVGFLCKLCIKRWTQLRRRALWTRRWSSQPL